MSSFDRLLQAAYTGPVSGDRISFAYRDPVDMQFDRRTDSYEFIGLKGSQKRDLALGPDQFPMTAIFHGADHDIESDRFITLLRELITPENPGYLEHPRRKIIPVGITGTVKVNMDPVHNANETTVTVTFEEQLILPGQQIESPAIETEKQFEKFSENAGADYAALISTQNTGETLTAKRSILDQVRKINETMSKALSASSGAIVKFNQIQSDILSNIDTLVKAPLTVAGQLQLMAGALAAVPGNITEKANLWASLYSNAVGDGVKPDDYYMSPNLPNRNVVAGTQLTASSAVANRAANITREVSQIQTTQEAYDMLKASRNAILKFADDMDSIQSVYYSELFQNQFFTSSKSFANLAAIQRLACNSVQKNVAGIKTSLQVTLKTNQTILHVCAKYYNDVSDTTLKRFIDANKLPLWQVYILPAGTTVVI